MSINPLNLGSGDLLDMLASDDLEDRLMAIEVLGEIGDEEALGLLRQRLVLVNRELDILVTAVDKLKSRLEDK
jgi:HEAT repeat protein